jgi:hypothetical protein
MAAPIAEKTFPGVWCGLRILFLRHLSTGPLCEVPAMLDNCVMRIGVTEDFRARGGREIRLAVDGQHLEVAEFLAVELPHLIVHSEIILPIFGY